MGYLLIDKGGAIILEKDILNLIKERDKPFFSSLLMVIADISKDILKTKLKQTKFEDFILYFGISNDYIFALISDIEQDYLPKVTDRVIDTLNLLSVKSIEFQANEMIRGMVQKEINKMIYHLPQSVNYVERIAYAVLQAKKRGEKDFLQLGDLNIEKFEPIGEETLPEGNIKADINEIIDAYFEGLFEKVVDLAPSLFNDKKFGEFAKVLYVKAALSLHSIEGERCCRFLNKVYTVVKSIKQEWIQKILLNQLFLLASPMNQKHYFYGLSQRFDEVREKMKRDDLEGTLYLVLLSPCKYPPMRKEILRLMKQKSLYQYHLNLALDLWDRIHMEKPESITDILSMQGELKSQLDKILQRKAPLIIPIASTYIFSHVSSILSSEADLDWAVGKLREAYEFYKSISKKIETREFRGPAEYYALFHHIGINLVFRLLLFMNDETALKDLDNVIATIKELLKKLLQFAKNYQIDMTLFYMVTAGLLATLSRVTAEKGFYYENMPELVLKLINEDFEDVFFFNKHIYAHYYVYLLDALGNTAIFIKDDTERINTMRRIAFELERVIKSYEHYPLVHDLVTLIALRLYKLLNTQSDKKKANNLAIALKGETPTILYFILKQVYD
ncbi:MAG: hypothetical protein ACP6IP_03595 [Candidatus Njordarchaeia archaeon]